MNNWIFTRNHVGCISRFITAELPHARMDRGAGWFAGSRGRGDIDF